MISIIMPVKNAESFLAECIDSILQQTFMDWELLAVDDGSTDHSYAVLLDYAKIDTRISVFKNKGDGIIEALQTGYAHSTGDMIHRMDADDIMPLQKLNLLHKKLSEHGQGALATGYVKYFAKEGVSNGYQKYEYWLNDLCQTASQWLAIYKECVIASPAWLIYREDFEACGAFNSNIYPEDYDLVFRFYQNALKVLSVDQVVHMWRDHSDRTSRNHPNYQQNAFFKIKLHYFFKLDRQRERPLVVWGAGPKGKVMAKLLKEMGEQFIWASNNPNKHGHNIYDQIMQSIDQIMQLERPQIVITVAQREAQAEIRQYLERHGLTEYADYYFFR